MGNQALLGLATQFGNLDFMTFKLSLLLLAVFMVPTSKSCLGFASIPVAGLGATGREACCGKGPLGADILGTEGAAGGACDL